MQHIRDLGQSIKEGATTATRALTGKRGYTDSLLGESLPDLLRKATAKTLVQPDLTTNQQVNAARMPGRSAGNGGPARCLAPPAAPSHEPAGWRAWPRSVAVCAAHPKARSITMRAPPSRQLPTPPAHAPRRW